MAGEQRSLPGVKLLFQFLQPPFQRAAALLRMWYKTFLGKYIGNWLRVIFLVGGTSSNFGLRLDRAARIDAGYVPDS